MMAGSGGAATGGLTGASTGGVSGSSLGGTGGHGAGSGNSAGSSGATAGAGAAVGSGGMTTGTGGSSAGAGGNSGGTAGAGAAGGAAAGTGGNAGQGPPSIDLFNGTDLSGWQVYRETSATSAGTLLSAADASKIFKVEGGAIRVYGDAADQSTQARYMMVTAASYSKYKLSWQYKWGTKKFAPYTDLVKYPRDAGVLFHIHADKTQVWPSSIEFQIKDGSTGDIFALYARCTSLARNGGTTFVDMAQGGTVKLVDGSSGYVQHSRSSNFEVPDWNSLELDVDAGTAVFVVNGHVVNRVLSVMDRAGKAVATGPIAFQAEHAEAYYRNIRIQVLP